MLRIGPEYFTASALTMMAFSEADKNRNGKIDEDEKFIFSRALRNYGDTGNGKISDSEAKNYLQRFLYIPGGEAIKIEQRYKVLRTQYDISNPASIPPEILNEFYELSEKINQIQNLQTTALNENFSGRINNLWKYLRSLPSCIVPEIDGKTTIYEDFISNLRKGA